MYTDLHLHTNNSDGKLSVAETIAIAKKKGIKLLSITDHDTIDGIKQAIEISQENGLICISGLELSCRNANRNVPFPSDISIHILAYNIDYNNQFLQSYLEYYHLRRKEVLLSLIEQLNKHGVSINYDDIPAIARNQMRIQDIINYINAYFNCERSKDIFLKISQNYYQELFMQDCPLEDAIKLILSADGIPVLAHAFFSYRDYDVINNTQDEVSVLLSYLCDIGIKGIEVFYPKFTKSQTNWLLEVASAKNLMVTAGSDFHGTLLRKEMINYKIIELEKTMQTFCMLNKYR